MTQLEMARLGRITAEMRFTAKEELVNAEMIRSGIAKGRIVIPKNKKHDMPKPCAIGEGLKTKVNANIGTSKDSSSISAEIKKMKAAYELGVDTIMDLSTGPGIVRNRRQILSNSDVPVGTVPIYEIVINCLSDKKPIKSITVNDIFRVLEEQAEDGVDFFTIHAGVTRKAISVLKENPRYMDVVSRGGAFLVEWMLANDKENPFFDHFDKVMSIAKKYDVTLSLGDGMRPGSVMDATDAAQVMELITLGELQKRAFNEGVQVMIEGPGHVPINQIEANVLMQKSICSGAPFYVLGPLVTDAAPGYDHITAAIGGALAGSKGADFLCYVTPAEHLRLPSIDDVREGVIAAKIAAHAADIAKGVKGALKRDIAISKARRQRNWEKQFAQAIDPVKPMLYRKSSKPKIDDVCTMCGEYCSIKMSEKCFERP